MLFLCKFSMHRIVHEDGLVEIISGLCLFSLFDWGCLPISHEAPPWGPRGPGLGTPPHTSRWNCLCWRLLSAVLAAAGGVYCRRRLWSPALVSNIDLPPSLVQWQSAIHLKARLLRSGPSDRQADVLCR